MAKNLKIKIINLCEDIKKIEAVLPIYYQFIEGPAADLLDSLCANYSRKRDFKTNVVNHINALVEGVTTSNGKLIESAKNIMSTDFEASAYQFDSRFVEEDMIDWSGIESLVQELRASSPNNTPDVIPNEEAGGNELDTAEQFIENIKFADYAFKNGVPFIGNIEVRNATLNSPFVAATTAPEIGNLAHNISEPSKNFTEVTADKLPDANDYIDPTPKENLYLKGWQCPSINTDKPWLLQQDGPDTLCIYTSLPEIPECQRDITCTTEISKMTTRDKLKLFPNHFIRTRPEIFYTRQEGLGWHPDLGVVIPVDDYSYEQVLDNIIRYPHFYRMNRLDKYEYGGDFVSFYQHIEIDGQLVPILQVWDSLPEAKKIPRHIEFIKEYLIRKYIMDEEIKGIKHKYPLFGEYKEFLTLFMPADNYIQAGYKDVEEIAHKCVEARVAYKRSKNPILRRLGIVKP